jgi:hypothetical protein
MNIPSTTGNNWAWRYRPEALNEWISGRLHELVDLYGRDPQLWEEERQKKLAAQEEAVSGEPEAPLPTSEAQP